MQESTFRFVVSVANQQSCRFVTRIQSHAVRGVELLELIPFASKMHQVLPCLVELENVVACVSIREKDIAVAGDGDGGWIEFVQVQSRFFGKAQSQNDLT